jgi:tetratricopeptide (TPR) repeat protein
MSFQGDISSIALSDVFQNLATNQKTGTLTIDSGGHERHIQFRDGKIVSFADGEAFSIADWLADKEIVDRERMDEALRRYRKSKKKTLGEILRDLGTIGLEDYRAYLSDLLKETLYEVLSFREGTFEFHEGLLAEEHSDRETFGLGIELPPQSIMMEAARRMDDWQKIRLHIPSENEIYLVPPAERERLLEEASDDLTREAIELMDGTLTLRQVIGKLPYSRFDGCRALAGLIAGKKVRPLDGTLLMQLAKGEGDPKQVISCLKTILEREPNNRQILKRLADLQEGRGQREESATYNKLLAISHLDEGDVDAAESHLRKSLELNPRDIATWQKLRDVVRRQAKREKILAFGLQFAEHFRKLGLPEIVRDHLADMVKVFPEQLRLKVDLADARFALGDKKTCVGELFEVAVTLLKKRRFDEAEKVFARILKYDHDNRKARELHEKLRSGKLARRQAIRQRLLYNALVCLLVVLFTAFLVYDLQGRGKLFEVTREVFAESLIENQRYDEAISRIRSVQDSYPFSLTASYEVPRLLQTLLGKQREAQSLLEARRGAERSPPPRPPAEKPQPPRSGP